MTKNEIERIQFVHRFLPRFVAVRPDRLTEREIDFSTSIFDATNRTRKVFFCSIRIFSPIKTSSRLNDWTNGAVEKDESLLICWSAERTIMKTVEKTKQKDDRWKSAKKKILVAIGRWTFIDQIYWIEQVFTAIRFGETKRKTVERTRRRTMKIPAVKAKTMS